MAERFSQQNQRVRPSSKEDQVVQKAKEHFERTLIPIAGSLAGSVAALQHPSADEALNYGEIFLRDNVPVMGLPVDAKTVQDRQTVPADLPRPPEHHLSNPWRVPNQLC